MTPRWFGAVFVHPPKNFFERDQQAGICFGDPRFEISLFLG
jgi:hypothetical protein